MSRIPPPQPVDYPPGGPFGIGAVVELADMIPAGQTPEVQEVLFDPRQAVVVERVILSIGMTRPWPQVNNIHLEGSPVWDDHP